MSYWKLGCRWGSKTEGKPLFFDILIREKIVISWVDKDFGNGGIVLLTDGFRPIGLGITKSSRKNINELESLEEEFSDLQIDFSEHLYYYDAEIYPLENADFTFDYQKGISRIWNKITQLNIDRNLKIIFNNQEMQSIIDILKYKKQIILQGPPGTGKTRLAKEIAAKLISENLKTTITGKEIESVLVTGAILFTPTNYNSFSIVKVEKDRVTVYPKDAKNEYQIPFSDIIKCAAAYKSNDQVSKFNTSGTGSYLVAIANYVVDELLKKQFKLIQFHPSFTYEDFVRGIVSTSDNNSIKYDVQNKILAEIANDAIKNIAESAKGEEIIRKENWLDAKFDDFVDSIREEIDVNGKIFLNKNIYINSVEEDAFRFKGDKWEYHINGLRMKFSDLLIIHNENLTDKVKIKLTDKLSSFPKDKAIYYLAVLNLFREFIKGMSPGSDPIKKVDQKNFYLIIDEINRANLSAVLGELIYALEYRGSAVDGLYSLDGDRKLILPPNLFIIGTMNTADRSVGHIDYAIRRRFAFVDVLPKILEKSDEVSFDEVLFVETSKLFIKDYDTKIDYSNALKIERSMYLSEEFNPKDVWLGHSYFIDKKAEGGSMTIRLKYEIQPILLEYVKDGVLKESAIEVIQKLSANI